MENYLMLNGKKIELTEQLSKILNSEYEKTRDIWNPKNEEEYCTITDDGEVLFLKWDDTDSFDRKRYSVANCCSNRKIMEKRALQEILSRLLWRFSLQNGWNDEMLIDNIQKKWFVYYNVSLEELKTNWTFNDIRFHQYFISEEIAQRAIYEIIEPFIEEHHELLEDY